MSEKEIFEQFIQSSEIDKSDVIDYRYCTKLYAGIYIKDAIIIQLDKKKYGENHIIYKAYDIDTVVKELSAVMGNNTSFEQGFHSALDEIRSYGKEVKHEWCR